MKRSIRISTLALAFSALVVNLSFTTPAQAGAFTETGPMAEPRQSHTATLLSNGKVLVAGGDNVSGVLTSAELYDPATGLWTATGAMAGRRVNHTATLLPNGKVLVAGGSSDGRGQGAIATAELYDPATGTWSPTAAMSTTRWFPTATRLPNGKVLVEGGYHQAYIKTAELYDPVTGAWTLTGSLSTADWPHTSVMLADGRVMVAGGWNGSYLPQADVYDSATGIWTLTGSMSTGRHSHTLTLLPDGKVLAAGGYNNSILSIAELYDPATGLWTGTSPMSAGRFTHTATLLPNGHVLVVGGQNLSSAEEYNPTTGTWTATCPMMNRSSWIFTSTLLPNGKVLVAGGLGNNNQPVAELYDYAAPSFQITSQPQSQLGYWGKSVSFSIIATSCTSPITYQWLKDGVAISDATNSLLVLTNLQLANAGIYTVAGSDTVTNFLSQPAVLTVNPAGVSIALYAGVTIDGVTNQTYGIQSTLDLSNTNSWAGRANVTLTNATQLWYDSQPATQPQTYYRVLPGPISVP